MHQGLTAVETAQLAGELHWVAARLFEVLGLWAGEADRPDIAVSLATSSRHLGWHADDLLELMPESVLLEDDAQSRPHAPEVADAVEAIRAIPGSIERLAVANRVLLPRVAARCVAVERAAANHSDAPFARVLAFLLADLRRDRDDGEALLGQLLLDVDAVEQINVRVLEAESRLVAVGGLLPARIQR
ncbi:MAG: hypothetical protein RIB98_18885 [Acidimicrobiales bacterium]